jgi:mannosyl-3-phosphoglycerate phosphatase
MDAEYVIFSDLDGTLLDHFTYSFELAQPALNLVHKKAIPLILVSSKTKNEIIEYQSKLNLNKLPFVVENGAAVYTPKNYFDNLPDPEVINNLTRYALGKSYNEIKHILENITKKFRYNIKGFHNSSVEEIAEITSLDIQSVHKALQREFSVPLFYDKRAEKILKDEIYKYDLHLLYGGRFMHLLSNIDKGVAVELIMKGFRKKLSLNSLKSVAIGDSLNDFAMLRAADIPILVKKYNGKYEDRQKVKNLHYSSHVGPAGWNQSILDLIKSGGKNE